MTQQGKKNPQIFSSRAVTFIVLSTLATFAFGVFNSVLYASHGALWNLCIAVYYFAICTLKAVLMSIEGLWRGRDDDMVKQKRLKANVAYRAMFFVVDLSLLAPISLMARNERAVNYSQISAIAFATYTVYKIVASSINFKKANDTDNLSAQTIRALNFKDAILSIIALQYVLVQTFGDSDGLSLLCKITNFALWGVIVLVSIYEIVEIARENNKNMAQ